MPEWLKDCLKMLQARKTRKKERSQLLKAKKTRGNEGKAYKPFTSLTLPPAELLEVVLQKPGVYRPAKAGELPRNPKSDKFCRFHNDYGHDTNDCRNLKAAIEKLIQEGHLLEYVRKEYDNFRKCKEDREEKIDPRKGKGPRAEEPLQKTETITMIYGGLTNGDSNRSRKASIHKVEAFEHYEVFKLEEGIPLPNNTFGMRTKGH